MIHRAVAQGRTCVHNAAVFVFLNSRIIYVATCATQIIETTHFSTTSTKGWHKKLTTGHSESKRCQIFPEVV